MPIYTGITGYLDTVIVSFPATANELSLRQKVHRYRGCRWLESHHIQKQGNGMLELKLHRPVAQMLEKVAEWIAAGECRLAGIDVARDFMAATQADAFQLHAWAYRHVVQSNRRKIAIKLTQGVRKRTRLAEPHTVYLQCKSAGRNTVIYSDKPSKVTGGPCCHIEARIRGSRTLQRMKLVDNLPALNDPVEQRRVWNQIVRFSTWDALKIGQAIVVAKSKAGGNCRIFRYPQIVAGLEMRAMMNDLKAQAITATVVAAVCNRFGLRVDRFMPAIDIQHDTNIPPRPTTDHGLIPAMND